MGDDCKDCLEKCYCGDDPPECPCVCCWIITIVLVVFVLGGLATAIWAMATYL